MTLDGTGKMYCLAGIGGRVHGIMANTRAAARVLVIDGCPQECARKTMELAGFKDFQHLELAEMGFKKGERRSPPPASGKWRPRARNCWLVESGDA